MTNDPYDLLSLYIADKGRDAWDRRFAISQQITQMPWEEKMYPRVRFGNEPRRYRTELGNCNDCGAAKGQFHCISCECEACPVCRGENGEWHSWSGFDCDHLTIDLLFH